ncbi:AAA family ATPase [Parabacteroides timonensis]|uniref:AAA family ATPase n=1 Tax=Parabacteroides timonensis TaxID=1871013 RepID=UPI00094F1636|nr:AAA family ATPase [Parabacteroides timonensis]
MDIYQLNHQQLLKGIRCNFQRYLYKQIQWDDRLIGVFGSQGVGKTTLLLQRIKLAFDNSDKALYLNLDSILFQREKMINVASQFYKAGGTHLFMDGVHRYPNWINEMKKLLERCPGLHIVFASSSLLPISKVVKGLKGVSCYTLNTMSFREYLSYECLLDLAPISLDDLLENHAEVSRNVNDQIVVAPVFRNYLEHGCYPFYWDDPDAYPFRLQDRIRDAIEIDLPAVYPTEYGELKAIKEMMMSISDQVPNVPRLTEIAAKLKLDDAVVKKYFDYLKDAVCIRHYQSAEGFVQNRIQKTYLGNTNLLTALEEEMNDRVILGETFFVDQLSNFASIRLLNNNDFVVNDKYTFMVGDPLMDYERIRDAENTFAAIYGQPKSQNNKLPIWLLGLCY